MNVAAGGLAFVTVVVAFPPPYTGEPDPVAVVTAVESTRLVVVVVGITAIEEELDKPEEMLNGEPLSGYATPSKEQAASPAVGEDWKQGAKTLTPTGGMPARLSLQLPGWPTVCGKG